MSVSKGASHLLNTLVQAAPALERFPERVVVLRLHTGANQSDRAEGGCEAATGIEQGLSPQSNLKGGWQSHGDGGI